MVILVYRGDKYTGLAEYSRVLMKGLDEIGYQYKKIPIYDNSFRDKILTKKYRDVHYLEPFSFVLYADLTTLHDLDFVDNPLYSHAYQKMLEMEINTSEYLVVSSKAIKEDVIKWNSKLEDSILISRWGIDTDLYNLNDIDIEYYDTLPHDKIRVLMVSTMTKRKNIIPVLKQLSNNEKFEITLITDLHRIMDLDYWLGVKAIIDKSNNIFVRSNLTYEELRYQYLIADIYLQPSLSGAFEMPIYEALSMGNDVVVYPLAVHKELMGNIPYYSDFSNIAKEIEDIVDFKKKPYFHDFIELNYSHTVMAKSMSGIYGEVFWSY
ncbi:MAG: hypothetical protein QXI16_00165 [Sulfolobaceae archaeon]